MLVVKVKVLNKLLNLTQVIFVYYLAIELKRLKLKKTLKGNKSKSKF